MHNLAGVTQSSKPAKRRGLAYMGENRRTLPTMHSIRGVSPINDREPHHYWIRLSACSVLPKEENRRDARRERVKPSCSVYGGLGVTYY